MQHFIPIKRLFALALCLCMALSCLPILARAEDTGNTATLNGTEYATFAEAYAAAEDGDTITLLADTKLPDDFTIETDLTLNLNGFELSQPGRWTRITGKTVINGPGKFDYVQSWLSGEVTVDGGAELPNLMAQKGTVIVRNAKIESLDAQWEGNLKVYGGTIEYLYLGMAYGSVILYGCSYDRIDLNASRIPATLGDVLGEGYTYFPEVDLTLSSAENVSVIPPNCYAIIGNTAYESLTTALSAAKSGDTVTLIRSQSIPADQTVTVPEGVTLANADGAVLTNGGTLQFSTFDSCALTELENEGTLQVNWRKQWQPAIFVEHALYLDGGDVTNEHLFIIDDNPPTYYTAGEGYVLYDGKATDDTTDSDGNTVEGAWGTVYLRNASITCPDATRENADSDTADIRCMLISAEHARVVFSGTNTITCGSSYASTTGLFAYELILSGEGEKPVLNIRGGSAEPDSIGLVCESLTVTSGTVNAIGGSAIGQSAGASVGAERITVKNGAVFNATGGSATGDSGISCGLSSRLGLTVEEGGVFNATGGSATAVSVGAFLMTYDQDASVEINGTLNVLGGPIISDTPPLGSGSMGLILNDMSLTVEGNGTVNGLVTQLVNLLDEEDNMVGLEVHIAAYGKAVMQGDLDVDGLEKAYAESGMDITTTFTVPEGTTLTLENGAVLDVRDMTAENVSILGTIDATDGKILCDHDGRENEATCSSLPVCSICKQEYGTLNPDRHDPNAGYGENGICPGGCYEPAQLVDGVYQIANAGNLYWFAQLVNDGTANANALVTKDFAVNENVLAEDGTLNEGSFRVWSPIGTDGFPYVGTFDGGKHTISGLYSVDNTWLAGLFGAVGTNGVIKNLNLTDSYFSGQHYIGGIVGDNQGTVENCSNAASVVATSVRYAGGIVGYNQATVRNCRNTGKITSQENIAGGIVGGNIGTVENCCATGIVTAPNRAGGIVGTNITIIRDAQSKPIPVSPVIKNCYYLDTCCEKGDDTTQCISVAKTAAAFASGEVTYLLNGDQSTINWYQTCGTGLPAFEGQRVYSGYLTCGMDAIKGYSNDPDVAQEHYDHEGGRANCHEKANCDNCNKPYGEIDTTHHDEAVAYVNGFCPYGCYEPAQLVDGVYQIRNAGNLYWFAQLVNSGETKADAVLVADIEVNSEVIDVLGNLRPGTFRSWTPIGTDEHPYEGTFSGTWQDIPHTIFGLYVKDASANNVGLFGVNNGTVRDLIVSASFFQGSDYVGSIAGTNNGTIVNCDAFNTVAGTVSLGGIAGQSSGTISYSYSGGRVVADMAVTSTGLIRGGDTVGGIVGTLTGSIDHCSNGGDIQAAYAYAGGIAGQIRTGGTILASFNRGDISGRNNVGGIAGISSGTVTSCYGVGTVTATAGYVHGLVGHDSGIVTASYYLSDAEDDPAAKTDMQFIYGEVTYLLNDDQSTLYWYQTIGNGYPYYEGKQVYYGYVTCDEEAEPVYTNTPVTLTRPDHACNAHSHECTVCGAFTPCHDTNRDHFCDVCGETMGEHKAAEGSHDCAYCGKPVTECADDDKDHNCDVCGKELTQCADDDHDGKCDICGKVLSYVTRLSGKNRYITAIKVADELKSVLGVEKFDTIIVAAGENFADALSGSYLSTMKNAPILLCYNGNGNYPELDAQNVAYIKENLAENGTVYILGGTAAVNDSYESELANYNVERLRGKNRFGTNQAILKEAGIPAGSEILVCTAYKYADSLSASATGKPILLVHNQDGKLYGVDEEFLSTLENCTFTIIGGTGAVGSEFEEILEQYGEVNRLSGKTRYQTSILVAETYFDEPTTAVMAYAWNYPDGLCGGTLAHAKNAPLILTQSGSEDAAVGYTTANNIHSGYVLGGAKFISDDSARTILGLSADFEVVAK